MERNFWQKLNKPFYALAPLAGVSDLPFRQLCKEYGADVVYSEMASTAALKFSPKKTLELIKFEEKERPYVVQLFGSDPEHFAIAAKLVTEEVKPDGIDINFGCPVPKVAKQNAGATLFRDIKLSHDIIKATIEATDLPVSIKTRTKSGDVDLIEFLDYMQDLDIKALMVHGRTLKQGFSGDSECEVIRKAREYFGGVIMANGGIIDRASAEKALIETGADGLGIARGAFGKPWIFKELKDKNFKPLEKEEIFKVIIRHAELVLKHKGEKKLVDMRKHLCWYTQGFPGAKALREKLLQVETINDIKEVLK